MSINKQQFIAAHILSVVRAGEARLGLASVRHYFQPLRLFPQLGGTRPRPAKNVVQRETSDGTVYVTRGQRKREQRQLVIDRLSPAV